MFVVCFPTDRHRPFRVISIKLLLLNHDNSKVHEKYFENVQRSICQSDLLASNELPGDRERTPREPDHRTNQKTGPD